MDEVWRVKTNGELTAGATSAQSAALSATARTVRLYGGPCHYKINGNPTATTSDPYIDSGMGWVYLPVSASDKIAAIRSDGVTSDTALVWEEVSR